MAGFPPFPLVTDVLASAQSALKNLQSLLTNFNPGGVTQTSLEALALALGADASTYPNVIQPGGYELLDRARKASFILSAAGIDLDNKAADVNVKRKQPNSAQGFVQFSFPAPVRTDTVILFNTIVASNPVDPSALPVLFLTTTSITVPQGQSQAPALVPITAQAAGSSGNQPLGSINAVLSGPYGLQVTNSAKTGGGFDLEGDDAPNGGLRARALLAIPNAAQGTARAIELAAQSYTGVITSRLLEYLADDGVTRQDGHGQLLVDDGTGTLGTNSALIARIQTDFTAGLYRGAGTSIHVVGATQIVISNVTITNLFYDQNYASTVSPLSAIVLAVQTAIYNYINALGIGQPVLIATIVKLAMEVPGVLNVTVNNVSVNGARADYQPRFSQTARMASANLVSVFASIAPPATPSN